MTRNDEELLRRKTVYAREELIARIFSVLIADEAVRGLWLSGSLGRGEGDDYSDIDAIVLTCRVSPSQVLEEYKYKLNDVAPTLFRKYIENSRTINVITFNWNRFDLNFVEKDELFRYSRDDLKPIFDKDDATCGLKSGVRLTSPLAPQIIQERTAEFIRILGLLPVVLGREQYHTAQSGAQRLKDML